MIAIIATTIKIPTPIPALKIPSITDEEFQNIAKEAEETCPISVSFSFEKVLVSAVLVE